MGDPGVDGRIILRWIFRNGKWGARTGSIRLRIGTGGRSLVQCGNEPLSSIKFGEFLD